MKFSTKGSLNDAQFIAILKDAAESGLTGMIRLENGPIIKAVYFQKGAISFASSNEKSDRLAEVLSVAGKLTPQQVQDAQARLKPNVSLGKTLVELGYISPKDLLWGARAQVDGILHKLLFWTQGKYQVYEGPLPREIIHLNLPVASVIFEGIMKTQNRDWVLQHIGSPEAIYAVPSDYQEQLQKLKFPVSPVASKLNGKRSLHDIAQLSSVDTFELCKTVVALQYLDLAHPIQDEPLQMTLNAPEQQQAAPALEDQPPPTSMEDMQELGQVLQLPTVEELQATASTTTENDPEKEEPEPEVPAAVIATEEESEPDEAPIKKSEPDAQIVAYASEKDNAVAEENVENNPVIVATISKEPEPVALVPQPEPVPITPQQSRVPMRDLVDESEEEEAPIQQSRMKQWVTILLVVIAAVGIYFYLQSSRKDPPATDQEEIAEEQKSPEPDPVPVTQPLAQAEVPPSESSSSSPIRAGNIAEAAKSWKKTLAASSTDYSIQIVIACQEQTVLDTYQLLNQSDQMIVLPIQFKGKSCYRVLYGQYESKQQANQAIRDLPEFFLKQASPPSVVILSRVLS